MSEYGQSLVPAGTQAGVMTKQEFGSLQVVRHAETAAMAIAAQAEAAVKARYSMAIARPRDWDDVRRKLLKECERPTIAAVAVYSKPQGRKLNETTGQWEDNFIEGLSIRFAEVAIRCMGNLMPEATAVYDDDKIRIVRVALSDLEANNYYVKDVVIEKTVERSKLKKGQVALRSRVNAYGEAVYVLPATDDEVTNKENAMASKALRNHVLRVVPGDLQDECRKQLDETFADKDAKDPDAARKEIADGFAQLNIMPSQIKAWLGHEMATTDEAERKQLRKIFATVKTGEMTWSEIMERREEQRAGEEKAKAAEAPSSTPTAPAKSIADLKQREASASAAASVVAPAVVQVQADEIAPTPKNWTNIQGVNVDQDDSGPCGHPEGNGVACQREGYNCKDIGYRCAAHVPAVDSSIDAAMELWRDLLADAVRTMDRAPADKVKREAKKRLAQTDERFAEIMAEYNAAIAKMTPGKAPTKTPVPVAPQQELPTREPGGDDE